MKGLMSIIEVMITGVILIVAFLHFFPQYSIRTKWSTVLLRVKVRDTLNTIDRLNKTYDFAMNLDGFENFMNRTFRPEVEGGALVWWRTVEGLNVAEEEIPYFTEGYRESIVDVVNTTDGYKVYSFTLGMGYPY